MTRPSDENSQPINALTRGRFLQKAGIGAAAVGLGGPLSGALMADAAPAAAGGSLNVHWWGTLKPSSVIPNLLDGFAKQYGVKVKFTAEPQAYPDFVTKYTTYMASGFNGIDALWLDDFTTASWGTAGWLEPLEGVIDKATIASVGSAANAASSVNGHLYRVVGNFTDEVFFYRKDLLAKAGVGVPSTWQEMIKAGMALSKGGNYGIGIAGHPGYLINEIFYYVGQAGGHAFQLDTPAARQALKFMYDMIHTYKIAPSDTVTNDYTALTNLMIDGKIAMWPVWDGLWGSLKGANSKVAAQIAISVPPRGPANGKTIAGAWGWGISKYAQNKDLAAKFIEYIMTDQAQKAFAATGQTPGRIATLRDSGITQLIPQAPYLSLYAKRGLVHYRDLGAQTQRLADAAEAGVSPYLNGQVSLDAAIKQAQARIDTIQKGH